MAATDVTVYLRRWDGRTTTGWSEADLEQILGHLSASSTQTAYGQDDVWFAAASPNLLIADARWPVNRRLTELFDVSLDATLPFGLRFTSESAIADLGDALNQCGWSGQRIEAPADLPQVYMQVYRSVSGLGQYATNLGTGLELVATGGGGLVPARIRTLGDSGSIAVNLDELSNSVTFNLTRDIGDLLDITEARRWNYILDALGATDGLSLVVQSGAASTPGRILRLKGANGISLSSDGKHLTITAPPQVIPITVESIAMGEPIVALSSSADVIRLRGLLPSADIRVQATDSDVCVVLAAELTTVQRITPPNGLLTVRASLLRLDGPTAVPILELSSAGVPRWRILGAEASSMGAGLHIQFNSALSGATPVWVPIATITDQQILNVQQLEVAATARTKDLTVTGNSTVADVSSSGQVRASSFRLQSEQTPLPSAADYSALRTRVAAVESGLTPLPSAADFAALQARVAAVETRASSGVGSLPFFLDDASAKIGGVPRYGLYRFSDTNPASFRMRVSSDVTQYAINFGGYGALSTFPSGMLTTPDFTLETWVYMTQLYGAAMVHVLGVNNSAGWYMGLNGGGRFVVETDSPTTSYGDGEFAPDTGSWCYLGVRMEAGTLTMWALQGTRAWNKAYTGVNASRFSPTTNPIFITLGRRFSGDYQYRHLISNVRWTNRAIGQGLLGVYPLDQVADTAFCCHGSPARNTVTGVPLDVRGAGATSIQPVTQAIGSYIP